MGVFQAVELRGLGAGFSARLPEASKAGANCPHWAGRKKSCLIILCIL
jgi:hypothetical protein